MVKINKIYTRTGDDGTTALVGGSRVPKDSLRVEAYGDVDELNSVLGWCRTLSEESKRTPLIEKLALIQNELFDIGAELACPPGSDLRGVTPVTDDQVTRIEAWIDGACAGLPELRSFVLPGGSPLNSALHIARTVCRRAERSVISLAHSEKVSAAIIKYLNRLGDLLFALARAESRDAKAAEYLWEPGKR